jgi:Na+/melibiose symporter-like transporter
VSRSPTSTLSLLAYGAPAAPLNILMLQLIVYIPPFYAQEIGLDLAAVGLVFFLARGWDAIIDPLVGSLSDNTRSRWGRRKPWVLAGTPVLMAATVAFCLPPENAGVAYLGITAFVFYVALTVVQIPYLSWGAELSRDYTERTRIGSFREGGLMAGIVIGCALPLFFFGTGNPSLREILTVFVVATVVMLPITVIAALRITPSAPHPETHPISLRVALGAVRRNKPLLRLLTGILFFWLGGSVYNALILFMVQFTLGLPNSAFLWLVFVQYIFAIVCLPLAVRIAHRLGRHRALIIGGVGFFAILPSFMLVEPGSLAQALVLFALAGTLTSFIWIMPPAMIADTVEYGMLKGGGDQAALYMALYLFAQKAALAAGVGIGMPLAASLGFDPTNPDTAIGGLNFTALILPGLLGLVGAAVMFHYPIDARRHAIIRRRLERLGLLQST